MGSLLYFLSWRTDRIVPSRSKDEIDSHLLICRFHNFFFSLSTFPDNSAPYSTLPLRSHHFQPEFPLPHRNVVQYSAAHFALSRSPGLTMQEGENPKNVWALTQVVRDLDLLITPSTLLRCADIFDTANSYRKTHLV